MVEILQTVFTPVATLIVGFFNYRLVSRGIEQMREATEARTKRDDKRHEETMTALAGRHEETMAVLTQQGTALSELIARTGLTSRPV